MSFIILEIILHEIAMEQLSLLTKRAKEYLKYSLEEEMASAYNDLCKALDNTKKEEVNIILGDFNLKVWKGRDGEKM